MPEATLLNSIVAHAWNGDGTMVAIAPNSNHVYIYAVPPRGDRGREDYKNWNKLYELTEHHMLVTGVDWHPTTNQILTSGQDRNAYVWSFDQNEQQWKPELVILRIGRAATCVKWSPDGQKFAAGSGSKQIPVCHYEESQSFWVAKTVKKGLRSTVMSLDWSPNNLFLIAGGSDFKCRIFSAFIKGVDQKEQDEPYASLWGNQSFEFGSILAEFDQARGWVESARFAPSGVRFAFTAHDSSVHFGMINGDGIEVATILRRDLPLTNIEFLSDNMAIAGGYDCAPVMYVFNNGMWEERGPIDQGRKRTKQKTGNKGKEKFNRWKAQAETGRQQNDDLFLITRHQNVITGIFAESEAEFTTCCIDGRVLFWNANEEY